MKSCPLQPIRLRFLFLKVALKNELEFDWLLKAPPLVCCTGFEVALPLCLFKWIFPVQEHLAAAMENGELNAHVRLSPFTSMRVVSTAEYTCKAVPIEVNGESRTCTATSQLSSGLSRILQNVISSHENTP